MRVIIGVLRVIIGVLRVIFGVFFVEFYTGIYILYIIYFFLTNFKVIYIVYIYSRHRGGRERGEGNRKKENKIFFSEKLKKSGNSLKNDPHEEIIFSLKTGKS